MWTNEIRASASLSSNLSLYGGLGPLEMAYNNYYSHSPFLLFHIHIYILASSYLKNINMS